MKNKSKIKREMKSNTHSAGLEYAGFQQRVGSEPSGSIPDYPTETKDRSYNITEPQINACSPTDCTGAVPVPPQSDAEMDSYLDVYQFQPVAVKKD